MSPDLITRKLEQEYELPPTFGEVGLIALVWFVGLAAIYVALAIATGGFGQ